MLGSLGWRARLVGDKVFGRRPMVPWSAIWNALRHSWDYSFPVPEFAIVEQDDVDGFVCLQAGERRYWIPAEAERWGLAAMYKEVFNPSQPHYYEFEGCRIEKDDVVIDGGACEGFFIHYALERGARVIAVEPGARMAEGLRRTYAKEIADGRVIIERALISDSGGMGMLRFNPEWPFGAHQTDVSEGSGSLENVPETSIDDLVDRSPWQRCDFIKLDIEGAEPGAIVGAARTLDRFHPDLAIAVYHRTTDYLSIMATLREYRAGYRTSAKGVVNLPSDATWRAQLLHAWRPARNS